jgi:transcriptional regulator with XRE-family HTH domain
VKLSSARIKKLCRSRGIGLGDLLRRAGVSRTAYYSLVRKSSILPKSADALAATLDVPPSRLIEEPDHLEKARRILLQVDRVMSRHPEASREDVLHTLRLLELKPIERLRRGLLRGRASRLH